MSTTPLPANQTATTINTIIADANSAGVKVIEALIIADEPWMGDPLIRTLLGDLLGWLDGYISQAEQNGATFGVIQAQVNSENSAVNSAVAEVIAAEKSGIPASIQKAIQDYANANSALGHFDGTAPAQ